MTVQDVLNEIKRYGNAQTKNILMRHGAQEPFDGVKVQDLKKIRKKTGHDHSLALSLFDTGHSDAMYLAGLISEPHQMTKGQLDTWARRAYWYMLSEYTVPWTAADGPHGFEMGKKWISSAKENIASSGWSTLSNLAITKADEDLDLDFYKRQLAIAAREIHQAQNRVRYTMNAFVMAAGISLRDLHQEALRAAEKIGAVRVDMGGTSCKIPLAADYIQKAVSKGKLGYKKKQAVC